jgi:uncharacterized membrane protein YidH (DUF202 family)
MPARKKKVARKKHAPRTHYDANAILNSHKIHLTPEQERTLFLKEQTVLAKERTILSFMRTGLGFITAGFAIVAATAVLRDFFSINPVASFIIGWAIVGVGFLEIIESFRRLRKYKGKMKQITDILGDENI